MFRCQQNSEFYARVSCLNVFIFVQRMFYSIFFLFEIYTGIHNNSDWSFSSTFSPRTENWNVSKCLYPFVPKQAPLATTMKTCSVENVEIAIRLHEQFVVPSFHQMRPWHRNWKGELKRILFLWNKTRIRWKIKVRKNRWLSDFVFFSVWVDFPEKNPFAVYWLIGWTAGVAENNQNEQLAAKTICLIVDAINVNRREEMRRKSICLSNLHVQRLFFLVSIDDHNRMFYLLFSTKI